MSKKHKIPSYYAWFIIIALLPQILRFNGSVLDSVFKIFLIGVLSLQLFNKAMIRYANNFTVIYLMLLVISKIMTFCINGDNLGSTLENFIITILLFYLFYVSPTHVNVLSQENVFRFYSIYVYFMIIACLYNMLIHFNSLIHLTSLTVYNTESICSFFDNKNTFGVFLLFAVLAATILKIQTRKLRWSLFIVVCIVNELMALCRTAIVISIILLILGMIADVEHRIRNIFFIAVCAGVLMLILGRVSAVNSYITETLFGNTQSLDTRNNYVENMLPLLRGEHLLFGYGDSQAEELALSLTGNQYYHNTYLKLLISGGILRFGLHISALIISFLYGIKTYIYNKTMGILCIISTAVYIVYAYVESVILFDTPVIAMLATIFVITMPILLYNVYFGQAKDLNKNDWEKNRV